MSRQFQNRLNITTPDGISFSLVLADPINRFIAVFIDGMFQFAVAYFLSIIIGIFGGLAPDWAGAVQGIVGFFVFTCYQIVLEWFWNGKTLGKHVLGLKVIDDGALQLRFSQVVIRNLLRYVDFLPSFYGLGGATSFFHPSYKRLGDIAAGTLVVHRRDETEPDLNQVMSGKYNSFRSYPHIEARIQKNISPEEARIALDAILRRTQLEPAARIALFEDIRDHVLEKVQIPDEVKEGLTPEQFVRNVVDTMYRVRKSTVGGESKDRDSVLQSG